MPFMIPILLLFIFSSAIILWIWLLTQFEKIEIRQQAKKILRENSQLEYNLSKIQTQLGDWDRQVKNQNNQVFDGVYRNLIAKTSLEALDSHAGIGPAILEKLKVNGVDNLLRLERSNLEAIDGIGLKRASDIRSALSWVLRDLRSRLESGNCPESVDLNGRLKKLNKEMELKRIELKRNLEKTKARLQCLKKPVEAARTVTFFGWLFGHPMATSIPEPMPLDSGALFPSNQDISIPTTSQIPFPSPKEIGKPNPDRMEPDEKRDQSIFSDHTEFEDKNSELELPQKPEPTNSASPPSESFEDATSDRPAGSLALTPEGEMALWARLAVAIGYVDGRLVESERLEIRRQLNEFFGGIPRLQSAIGAVVQDAASRKESVESALEAFSSRVEQGRWPKCLQMLVKVADASGSRTSQEGSGLSLVRIKLGMGVKDSGASVKNKGPEDLTGETKGEDAPTSTNTEVVRVAVESPRALLEILDSAPLTEGLIRNQWKLLLERYDPNRLISHGQEFVEMAIQKRCQIDHAAKQLLEEIGSEPILEAPPRDLRENPDLDAAFGL